MILRRSLATLLAAMTASSPLLAESVAFNDDWRFARTEIADDGKLSFDPDAMEIVTLPHTTRIEPRVVNDQWQGIALYEKTFDVPAHWAGQTVMLRIEAAMNVADIFLNGKKVASHSGGYLPFTVDLTHELVFGAQNRLVIRLDNRDNSITGPKPLAQLDFNTYGGLYRGVRLIVKPPVHLSDEMLADRPAGGGLFVTFPSVSPRKAVVQIQADIRNAGDDRTSAEVRQQLFDGDRMIADDRQSLAIDPDSHGRTIQTLHVEAPDLWSPQSPHLYRLVTTVIGEDGQTDRSETNVGIRSIAFGDDGELLLNGQATFLRGVNRHQEYPYVGYAISPNADYRDAKLIKEAGFDYVRLSHYPHSPAFMAAADELGLLLIDAILGWQYYNPDPAFEAQVLQTCRDMIRRDRNHPSVLAWECSLNESQMPVQLVRRFDAVVGEEYPGGVSAGWQNDGYDIFLQARQHRLQHYEAPDRPYVVSEYGDWEYYAQNAGLAQDNWAGLKEEARTSRQSLDAGEARLLQQATNVQEAHDDNLSTPAFADGYWAMFDYNRGYADDLEHSGLASIERMPKFAYWFFASQRDPAEISSSYASGPMVRIASHWTEASDPLVRVFSNAKEVELFLNGRSIGKKTPVRDRLSQHIAHPPFEFLTGGFEPGLLEAVAYIGGREVARDRVETAGPVASLCTWIADGGVAIAPGDLVFARARLIDERARPVFTERRQVVFRPPPGWTIIGQDTVTTEAGIASVLMRADGTSLRSIDAGIAGGPAVTSDECPVGSR